jgi:hypothetical protein
VQNGIRNVGYVRMRAKRVSKIPSLKTMAASGMKRIDGGTRLGEEDREPGLLRAAESQPLDGIGGEDARGDRRERRDHRDHHCVP